MTWWLVVSERNRPAIYFWSVYTSASQPIEVAGFWWSREAVSLAVLTLVKMNQTECHVYRRNRVLAGTCSLVISKTLARLLNYSRGTDRHVLEKNWIFVLKIQAKEPRLSGAVTLKFHLFLFWVSLITWAPVFNSGFYAVSFSQILLVPGKKRPDAV